MSTLSVNTIRDVQNFDPVNTVIGAGFATANAGYGVANASFTFGNTVYAATNSVFSVANAAFGVANTALQNANTTLAGSLITTRGIYAQGSSAGVGTGLANGVYIGTQGDYGTVEIVGNTGSLIDFGRFGTDFFGRIIYDNSSNTMTLSAISSINLTTAGGQRLIVDSGGNTRFLSSAAFFKTDGNPGKGSKIFLAGSDNGDQWIGAGQNTAYWMEYSGNANEGHVFRTGSVERMVISGASSSSKVPANSISLNPFSAGYVTMPNQPAFSVSYSGGGYVASEGDSNTWDAVLWNTATGSGRFNNGNHYNGATGCFTAPVSGKYMFMTQIHHHAGGGTTSGYAYMDLAFGTTGSQAAIVGATSFHRNIMSLTTDTWWEMPPQVTILNLAANDSIFVRIVNTGGATFLGSSRADHNRWSCWFLG